MSNRRLEQTVISLNMSHTLWVCPCRATPHMTDIVYDDGERIQADSRHDSTDEEKEKRKLIAKGGV